MLIAFAGLAAKIESDRKSTEQGRAGTPQGAWVAYRTPEGVQNRKPCKRFGYYARCGREQARQGGVMSSVLALDITAGVAALDLGDLDLCVRLDLGHHDVLGVLGHADGGAANNGWSAQVVDGLRDRLPGARSLDLTIPAMLTGVVRIGLAHVFDYDGAPDRGRRDAPTIRMVARW